jgi:hypothetical protein
LSADLDFRTRYLSAGVPFSTEVIHAAIHHGYSGWTFNALTNSDLDTDEIT